MYAYDSDVVERAVLHHGPKPLAYRITVSPGLAGVDAPEKETGRSHEALFRAVLRHHVGAAIDIEEGGRRCLGLYRERRTGLPVIGHLHRHAVGHRVGRGQNVDLRGADVIDIGGLAVDGDADAVE